jgi:TctA family transporter
VIDALWAGLALLLEPATLSLMLLGVAIGFAVGVLPGLGGAVTLALMIPFTFGMEPVQVFAFLLGMWVVTSTTGDITSVLFGIPGESTSAAAILDGYPLSRKGQAGRALGAVLTSSFIGAVFGAIVLAASIPIIRPIILSLGPPSFFALTLVGLTFIIALAGKNILRGFLMACFGFVVGMVGLDTSTGIPRYTFDQLDLWDGIGLVPLVVGLFGGAEVLQLMLSRKSVAQVPTGADEKVTGIMDGVKDAFRHWWLAIRCSSIGVGLGVVPGMGGSVAQFIAYGHAQATSKSPETFGKGNIEGVVAAGANNNAKDSGSLIPTIAFGIPGSVGTAVLLGAFLVAGVTPGTEMLTTELPLTMSMVWVMVLANLVAVAVAFVALRPLAKLTYIRGTLLVPFLLVLLGIGAFTSSNTYFDVYVMLAAAAVGVLALRFDWPRVPFLLAAILGAIAERYLFLSVSLSGWSWLNDPIVLVLFTISALAILRPVVKSRRARAARRRGDGPPSPSRPGTPEEPSGSRPQARTDPAQDGGGPGPGSHSGPVDGVGGNSPRTEHGAKRGERP